MMPLTTKATKVTKPFLYKTSFASFVFFVAFVVYP